MCVPYQMRMASVSKHERLIWNRRLFGPFWFGGMSNGWIVTLGIFHGRRNIGSPQKLMVGEVRVFDWTIHTQKYVNGHDNSWLLLHHKICPIHMGALWNDAKNKFTLGLCHCLACKPPTLGKEPCAPHYQWNTVPKIYFKMGGNISSE